MHRTNSIPIRSPRRSLASGVAGPSGRATRFACVPFAPVARAFVRFEFCRSHLARKIGPRHPAKR